MSPRFFVYYKKMNDIVNNDQRDKNTNSLYLCSMNTKPVYIISALWGVFSEFVKDVQ